MNMMTRLLERNEQFARTYTSAALGLPTAQVVVVACLDHRVDPAIVFGLQLGEVPVIRNAGGRVTQSVIDDVAFLAYLIDQLSGAEAADTRHRQRARHHHRGRQVPVAASPAWPQVPARLAPAIVKRAVAGRE
jgi:carbonic anhydrase